VAKKRKDRRGRREFLWNMLQFFDFARFLFHHMIAFVGPALSRDPGVDRAGLATASAPACRFAFSRNPPENQTTRAATIHDIIIL
jgi:hypothetical protein